MHVRSSATIDWEPAVPHRSGPYRIKRVLTREGHLRGLEMTIASALRDNTTPRHHHNFDQIRIGLAGELGFGTHQKLRERTIVYTPEGTWYGPSHWRGPESGVETLISTIQFDGEHKCGYLTYDKINAATEELRSTGEFKGGFYYPNEPGEKKAVDGYQAGWERASGKTMEYPPSLVDEPIYMNIDAVPWIRSDESGVDVKQIGAFGNHGLRISMARLAPSAEHLLGSSKQSVIGFVLSGEAAAPGSVFGLHSTVLLESGESMRLAGASEQTELIEIALPNFANLN